MKTTLLKIMWQKEKKHWKRIKEMLGKVKGWGMKLTVGAIMALLIIIAHYGFMIIHTLYETFLFFVSRKAFKANLQKLSLTV